MAEDILTGAMLVVDDPCLFSDDRGNPKKGRLLVYRLADGTRLELQVTLTQYQEPASVRGRLLELAKAHDQLGQF